MTELDDLLAYASETMRPNPRFREYIASIKLDMNDAIKTFTDFETSIKLAAEIMKDENDD